MVRNSEFKMLVSRQNQLGRAPQIPEEEGSAIKLDVPSWIFFHIKAILRFLSPVAATPIPILKLPAWPLIGAAGNAYMES